MKNTKLLLFAVVLLAPLCVNAMGRGKVRIQEPANLEIIQSRGYGQGDVAVVGIKSEQGYGTLRPLNDADYEVLASTGYVRQDTSFNEGDSYVKRELKQASAYNARNSFVVASVSAVAFVASLYVKDPKVKTAGLMAAGGAVYSGANGVRGLYNAGSFDKLFGRKSDEA